MDKAYVESGRVGYTRCSVYKPDMDDVLKGVMLTEDAADLACQEIVSFNSDGSPNYNPITVQGSIQPKGSNLKGLPITDSAKYQYTLITPGDVAEADRITDCTGQVYDVHDLTAYWRGDSFIGFQCELFMLEPVTYKRRISASAYNYVDSTILVSLSLRGQSSINPQEYFGPYDYVCVTINRICEGDRVVTRDGEAFEVMQVSSYPFTRSDLKGGWTVAVLVRAFPAATLRTLTLGSADSTTGLYASSYAESTVYLQIFNPSKGMIKMPAGYYGKYDFIGLTSASVLEGDQLEASDGTTYEVTQVSSYPTARTDITLTWRVLGLTKRDFADQPATSGTWHVDSATVKTDPRYKIKLLVDANLTAANIKKDDGTTNATTVTCFDGATYPITRLFLIKTLDALAVIRRGDTTILYTDKLLGRKPYATEEQVFIHVYAVNKSTITATNIAEKYENEIKRILTTYDPYTNVRDLEGVNSKLTDLGYGYLYETTVEVNYKRGNDDYVAALPTVTYGDSQATTYTFPNATEIRFSDPDTGDVRMLPPGRIGDILQILGSSDFEVTIVADLDIDAPSNKRWKRPQSSSAITDSVPWQVFSEIRFGGKTSANQVYQNLNWGGGTTIPVRLTDFQVEGNVLTVTFKRYSSSSGSAGTAKQWYGMT